MSVKNKKRLAMLQLGTPAGAPAGADTAVAEPAATAAKPTAAPKPAGATRRSMLANQDNALGRMATGKQRVVQTMMHDPARVRLWDGHNRLYDQLDESRCRDLIEGFKRVGRQEFAAIARKLDNDAQYDYELICGARRHWTASFLSWDLLIEVRDLTDRQAFILQDIENRDREDISDFERARDYQAALPKYFANNQAQMASFLEIDKSNFGKILELTKVAPEIVAAYADIRELKTHHGTVYRQLFSDNASKQRVLARAKEIAAVPLPGKQVIAELKKAAAGKALARRNKPQTFGALTLVRTSAQGKLAIDCQLPKEMSESALQALRDDFGKLLAAL